MQLRDICKAYSCFRDLGATACISTGRWGCGVFGGLPAHKFTQQVIAATLAGTALRFSTFGTPDGCDKVLDLLERSKCTVASLWQHLSEIQKPGCRNAEEFIAHLHASLLPPSMDGLRSHGCDKRVLDVGPRWSEKPLVGIGTGGSDCQRSTLVPTPPRAPASSEAAAAVGFTSGYDTVYPEGCCNQHTTPSMNGRHPLGLSHCTAPYSYPQFEAGCPSPVVPRHAPGAFLPSSRYGKQAYGS